jgi:hypothetical protein
VQQEAEPEPRPVQRIQRDGLEVKGGFSMGFDSDTLPSFRRLVDFI